MPRVYIPPEILTPDVFWETEAMKPAADLPTSGSSPCRDLPLGPPTPTGDPLIDEVRAMKYELSARFDHDVERLDAHLKAVQEDIARTQPQRIVRQPRSKQ